jgi:hypothetical protein
MDIVDHEQKTLFISSASTREGLGESGVGTRHFPGGRCRLLQPRSAVEFAASVSASRLRRYLVRRCGGAAGFEELDLGLVGGWSALVGLDPCR